jgi:hypothetical protein
MARLRDEDEDDHKVDAVEIGREDGFGTSIPSTRPAPRPPEGGLRGRTLCLFTTKSRVRKAMDKLIRNPYVLEEPS